MDELVEAATKKPPAVKQDGAGEAPMVRLRYFVKEGVIHLSE